MGLLQNQGEMNVVRRREATRSVADLLNETRAMSDFHPSMSLPGLTGQSCARERF
jgi:hypothetical protein